MVDREWCHRWLWRNRPSNIVVAGGASALAYGAASLAIVFLNTEVLDGYEFPSTSAILAAQLAATLATVASVRTLARVAARNRGSGPPAARVPVAKLRTMSRATNWLSALFMLDVVLGHVATRALGLDAFATFRRFSIPFAFHLELRFAQSKWSSLVATASWAMVVGPLLGLFLGRGNAPESTHALASTATEAALAFAEIHSDFSNALRVEVGSSVVARPLSNESGVFAETARSVRGHPRPYGRGARVAARGAHGGAQRRLVQLSPKGAAYFSGAVNWDAHPLHGCVAALLSAFVVAARVVYLRHLFNEWRAEHSQFEERRHADPQLSGGGDGDDARPSRSRSGAVESPGACGEEELDVEIFHIPDSDLDVEEEATLPFLRPAAATPRDRAARRPRGQDASKAERSRAGAQSSTGCHSEAPGSSHRGVGASAADLLIRTTALSLPCVLVVGAAVDAAALRAAYSFDFSARGFPARLAWLVALGPAHETAIYACVLHNSAVTTLISGGFKSTALASYRAVLGGFHNEPSVDGWDAVGMLVSAAASLVYTRHWWLTEQRQDTPDKSRVSTAPDSQAPARVPKTGSPPAAQAVVAGGEPRSHPQKWRRRPAADAEQPPSPDNRPGARGDSPPPNLD